VSECFTCNSVDEVWVDADEAVVGKEQNASRLRQSKMVLRSLDLPVRLLQDARNGVASEPHEFASHRMLSP